VCAGDGIRTGRVGGSSGGDSGTASGSGSFNGRWSGAFKEMFGDGVVDDDGDSDRGHHNDGAANASRSTERGGLDGAGAPIRIAPRINRSCVAHDCVASLRIAGTGAGSRLDAGAPAGEDVV